MFTLIGSFFGISYTWLWLIFAILFAVVEALTLGIVSIWFAIGALVAMLFAFVINSFFVQLIIFLFVSLILIYMTRSWAIDRLKIGKEKTNIDELIGKECLVIKDVAPFEPGEVKLDGKIWRCVSESKTTYQVNDIVEVLRIEGVTIIVK
ncbi:MAG TPA: NfeD family protein [Firmicutes bacterium]|nr:NfeD family protein [Bacillota bacterium]